MRHLTWTCQYCNTEFDASIDDPCQCDGYRLAQLDTIAKILDGLDIPCHDNQAIRVGELVLRYRRRDEMVRKMKTADNSPYKRRVETEEDMA